MKYRAIWRQPILIGAFFAILLLVLIWAMLRYQMHKSIDDALIDAIRAGSAPVVRSLLEKGANPNTRLKPHTWWLNPPSDEEAAEEPSREPTVLMLAAMRGDIKVVRVLLEGGADIHAKDNMGNTVLDWAGAHPEVIKLLQMRQK